MTTKIAILETIEEPTYVAVRARAGLTAQREQILARRIREHGDPVARQELIEATLPLVFHVARRFKHSAMSREDLIAEGNLGLIRAVERFDPGCGTRFHTYARWWIREAIQRAITQYGRMIRVPEYLARRLRDWSRRRNELQHLMQRRPADEEIGGELGYSKRQSMGVLTGLRVSTTGNPSCLDQHTCTPDDGGEKDRGQAAVHTLLERLDPNLRGILEIRYGLGDCDSLPRSVRQTADMLHLSRQDVRQMERDALLTLRHIVRRRRTRRTATDGNS